VELALDFMVNGAFEYNLVNMLSHLRPKEVFPEDIQDLIQAKVASNFSIQ